MSKLIKITDDLDDLVEDLLKTLRKSGAEMTGDAQTKLADAAEKLALAAQGVVAETRRKAGPLAKHAVEEVKAHPIATAATLAMAAAAVAGLLLSHRKEAKA
jgi:ElaB/YqjD/DUF883 family membrane-anchored ribosome-binding protein